jgi:2-keto-4-pentenoate hydratase/2-oxohepta-3-ene-1,7-dioic acid hydratase in catechol pathway
MRLISYRPDAASAAALGVVSGERALSARSLGSAVPGTMDELLTDATAGLAALRDAWDDARIRREGAPVAELALMSPVPRPGKVVGIGKNYPDHVTEQGAIPPAEPLIFAKFTTSVIGAREAIRWDPALTSQVDYEAELAVVIGWRTRNVSAADALKSVLGYSALNDISARDLQFGDKQWVRGKSLDTFCPIGPVLVTTDEIADPGDLAISCTVNGQVLQSARTADMFYNVAQIISHCSRSFTLEPGDVIATGTPGGVGVFRDPPIFLRDGDEVVVTIERIGSLVNPCRAEEGRP